ncbi:MAG: hypothetical protein ACFFA7_09115 [Promethearchaeota archaeon]
MKKGNFNFKSGNRSGGVGLAKLLPDKATTKPIIIPSILLFFFINLNNYAENAFNF